MAASPEAVAVLVAPPDDPLATAVRRELAARGRTTLPIAARELGDARLTLDSATSGGQAPLPSLDGEEIGAVLWRVPPDGPLTRGWSEEDRSFADAEVRSAWLAVLEHPGVFAVNRLGADLWFEGAGWAACRRRLQSSGVSLSPMGYAGLGRGAWIPYGARRPRSQPAGPLLRPLGAAGAGPGPSRPGMALFGRQIDRTGACGPVGSRGDLTSCRSGRSLSTAGSRRSAGPDAAAELDAAGIHLAGLSTDAEGRICRIDPLPPLSADEATRIAPEIAERMHAHLSGR